MSDHVSKAANRGQAINDALSDEAKAAVEALPATVLQSKHAGLAAGMLSRSVQAMHEINPNAWSIGCDGPCNGGAFVFANAGAINVVSLLPAECRVLLLKQAQWSNDLSNLLEREIVPNEYNNKDLVQVRLSNAVVEAWPEREAGLFAAIPEVMQN